MSKALDEMKDFPNWIVWKLVQSDDGTKPLKLPLNPKTGKAASTTDKETWGTFAEAKSAYKLFGATGLGFVFSVDTPFVGIDLDDCIVNGELTEFAKRHIAEFNSYTEYSPSKKGVHIIAKSKYNFQGVTSERLEIYSHGRYFTITGNMVENTLDTLTDVSGILRYRVTEKDFHEEKWNVTLSDVEEMLSFIPGEGLDYNSEWLPILMAVHSEFPGTDGLQVVENWTGAYSKPNEVANKWRKFNVQGGIGIGTLIYFAKRHGWIGTADDLKLALESVEPKLSAEQLAQAIANTNAVIRRVEEKAWKRFHANLAVYNPTRFPDEFANRFQLGYTKQSVNEETGEILPEAIVVPYLNYAEEPICVEYRNFDGTFRYDGSAGIYVAQNGDTAYGIVLPDSLNALDIVVRDDSAVGLYGLPHMILENSTTIPDKELYVIVPTRYTNMDTLEILGRNNAKFIVVPNVDHMIEVLNTEEIISIAKQGKKFKDMF